MAKSPKVLKFYRIITFEVILSDKVQSFRQLSGTT